MAITNEVGRLPFSDEPKPGECLVAYIQRIAALNGYPSPRWVADMLRVSSGIITPLTIARKLDRLAQCVEVAVITLKRSAFLQDNRSRMVRLPTNELVPLRYLATQHARICEACLHEGEIQRASWSIHAVAYCHVHRRPLVQRCGGCGKRYSHVRPAPICLCGYVPKERPSIPQHAADLAGWLERRWIMGLEAAGQPPAGVPDEFIEAAAADQMRILHFLAKTLAPGRAPLFEQQHVDLPPENRYALAYNALTDWPHRYHGHLKKLLLDHESETKGLRLHDKAIHRHVAGINENRTDSLFPVLFEAFSEFIASAFSETPLSGRGCPKVMEYILEPDAVSRETARKRLGVRKEELDRLVRRGVLACRRYTTSTGTTYAVLASSLNEYQRLIERGITIGGTAKKLGVSKYQVDALLEKGVLKRLKENAPVISEKRKSIDNESIEALDRRLTELVDDEFFSDEKPLLLHRAAMRYNASGICLKDILDGIWCGRICIRFSQRRDVGLLGRYEVCARDLRDYVLWRSAESAVGDS